MTVVSLADATVVDGPRPLLGMVYRVAWAGQHTVVLDGATATQAVVDRVHVRSGEQENLLLPTPDSDVQVDDVSPDGSTLLVSTLDNSASCLRAYSLDDMRDLWSRCDVTLYSRSPFSPDGAGVLVASTQDAGPVGPRSLEVLDAATGDVTGTIVTSDITAAEWSTTETVLVETEETSSPLTHALHLCDVGGECSNVGTFDRVEPGVG